MRGPTESTPVQRRQLRDVARLIAAADEARKLYDPEDHPQDGTAARIAIGILVMVLLGVVSVSVVAILAGSWPWSR